MSPEGRDLSNFLIESDGSCITIRPSKGRASMMSSSMHGGHFETIDRICIANGESHMDGFSIDSSTDIRGTSICSMEKGLTSVTALAMSKPEGSLSIPNSGYGTVIVLMANVDMPPATMARAIMTSTEAVTCAFQQRMIASPGSRELASCSGSMCITVLSDIDSGRRLYGAGKHSKFGELIGRTVLEATLASLGKNGASAASQANVLRRLERFGVTKGSFKELIPKDGVTSCGEFDMTLDDLLSDENVLAHVSAAIHALDEVSWGLIPKDVGHEVCIGIMEDLVPNDVLHSHLGDDPIEAVVKAISMMAYNLSQHR